MTISPRALASLFWLVGLLGGWAHAVDQIYGKLTVDGDRWEVLFTFDIGFSEGDWTDPDTPQKPREYLLKLNEAGHELLRRQTVAAVRASLEFGKSEYVIKFPDYETEPRGFPELMNDGAYLRVQVTGVLDRGRLEISVKDGDWPSFVIMSGEGETEEFRTFWSGDRGWLVE